MNTVRNVPSLLSVIALSLVLSACATTSVPMGAAETRSKLVNLQGDPQLANLAPVAIKSAEAAVATAERPTDDKMLGQHRVVIADRKVETARALAQTRLLETQRTQLSSQRESARLESRTREADMAHSENSALKQQIAELNAKETERGLAITLGDILFATGKSELLNGGANHLEKLVAFLEQQAERTVLIEGHTDSVGSADSNLGLSQRRADSVKSYMQARGINGNRINASGKGETSPVASNDSSSGRQMNRRVEIIISNPPAAR